MSLEGFVISLTILVVVGLWVAAPLLGQKTLRGRVNALAQKQSERLLNHYERILNYIRDLDEDYATGKIQQDDYDQERAQWVQRGIQILMALDNLEGSIGRASGTAADSAGIDEAVDKAIETAVTSHRRKTRNFAG